MGLIGLVLPEALGMGYGWVQVSMSPALLSIPLWVVLLLPFAKIVTTGFSIGSGGSGGIFGPGMVIGAMVGAIVWRLSYHVLPGVPDTPAPFVIVGMMALFGGIAHAPLAVMLMVAEMTGNLSMLAPAMIAVGISVIHGWGEDDLHQPGRHACRLACAPAAILVPAALDAGSSSGDDSHSHCISRHSTP